VGEWILGSTRPATAKTAATLKVRGVLGPGAAARQRDETWWVGGGVLERRRRCSDDLGVSRHPSLWVGRGNLERGGPMSSKYSEMRADYAPEPVTPPPKNHNPGPHLQDPPFRKGMSRCSSLTKTAIPDTAYTANRSTVARNQKVTVVKRGGRCSSRTGFDSLRSENAEAEEGNDLPEADLVENAVG
jgi:hypothetical protein